MKGTLDRVEDIEPKEPEEIFNILSVDRLRLRLGQLLQEGTFGRVYQGTLMTPSKIGPLEDGDDVCLATEKETDVFVKTVIAGTSTTQCQLLVKEGVALFGTGHNHIHTLAGMGQNINITIL